MAAFVVLVNGRQVCSIDLGTAETCGFGLTWIGPADNPLLVSYVGAMLGGEQLRWDLPELGVGDEVTVRIALSGVTSPAGQRMSEWSGRAGDPNG